MFADIVPGSYVVPAWLTMNGGGLAVPKRTSCEAGIAARRPAQVGVDAHTFVARWPDSAHWPTPGSGSVVKLHTVPVVVPELFFSSIRQKYVVFGDIVPGCIRRPGLIAE